MPILSVFATLLKSRFFVIYFRGVTLAEGKAEGLWQSPSLFAPQKSSPLCTRGLWQVAISACSCYNTPNKNEVVIPRVQRDRGNPHLKREIATPVWSLARNDRINEDFAYDKSAFCMPREDFPEFLKTLVPLRKFAFQNDFYQRFTNEIGEPNLQ